MPDTNVKLNATIDATSKGLQEALDRATNAVNSTTSKWQSKMKKVDAATDSVAQHVGKLNELLAKAAEGVVDTNAIQAEMEALEHAQHELDRASNEMDRLAQTADKAGKAVAQAAQETDGAASGFDKIAGSVKVANVTLKDLKDAFSEGANSAAAMANIYMAAFQLIVNAVTAYGDAMKSVAEHERRINELVRERKQLQAKAQIEDASSVSGKMQELYNLRANWRGTEEEKAREKILQREIELLQAQLKAGDRIAASINGQTVAQEKLAAAISRTMAIEQRMRKEALQGDLNNDILQFRKLEKGIREKRANNGLLDELSRRIEHVSKGDFGGALNLVPVTVRDLNKETEELYKVYNRILEKTLELQKVSTSKAGEDFYSLEQARQRDKGRNAAAEAAGANLDADEALKRLNLSPEDRAIADERRKIEAEYNAQLRAGVDAEKANEIRDRQLDELEKRIEAEKAKKEAAYLDELKKRTDAMEQARQRYEAAEKDVERAQKAYADAQDDLAREARAEAMRQRRQSIRDSLSRFGFRVADSFDQYESAVDRHRRVRLMRTDAGIADKMARWSAGEKVHFSVRERDRLAEYQDLQEEDAQLEAAQKQMEAAARQENSAERLSAAADAVKSAASRLDEAREGVKALVAPGVNAANAANYNDKLQQLHTDLQEMARRTFRVI